MGYLQGRVQRRAASAVAAAADAVSRNVRWGRLAEPPAALQEAEQSASSSNPLPRVVLTKDFRFGF